MRIGRYDDFTGKAGCAATGSSCAGLGGDGLGAGLTRIYDGKGLQFGGSDYLYVAAGNVNSGLHAIRGGLALLFLLR